MSVKVGKDGEPEVYYFDHRYVPEPKPAKPAKKAAKAAKKK